MLNRERSFRDFRIINDPIDLHKSVNYLKERLITVKEYEPYHMTQLKS